MIEPLESRVLLSATFYVSVSGSDANPGTSARPWRHVQKAFDSGTPGSTVLVMAGTYHEAPKLHVHGNATAGFITFKAAGKAVIDGSGITSLNLVTLADFNAASYVRIDGFELVNHHTSDQGAAIWFEGSGDHVEILNNTIHHFTGFESQAIGVYGSNSRSAITNLLIQGNIVYDGAPYDSEAITVDGNVNGFQIRGNTIHDVNNIGIDMIGGEGISVDPATGKADPTTDTARNGVCEGNRVYNAHQKVSTPGAGFAAGIYVDGGKNITVQRNTVSDCDIGIEVGSEHKGRIVTGVVVRNNIVYHNNHFGIGVGGFESSVGRVNGCKVLNNTLYNNDAFHGNEGVFGAIYMQLGTGNQISNNIIVASSNEPMIAFPFGVQSDISDYNLFFGLNGLKATGAKFVVNDTTYTGLSAYVAKFHLDTHSKFVDPRFVAAASANFHIGSTSPAINAGDPAYPHDAAEKDIDWQTRVLGGRVDVGADEVK